MHRESAPQKPSGSSSNVGEAYFIVHGTPQKASETQTYSANDITESLLQFDLRFDSLRNFLESVVKVVNQHATLLNKVQIDVNSRTLHDNFAEVFKKISTKPHVNDQELWKLMVQMVEKPMIESSGVPLDDHVNIFCNRIESFGCGFDFLNKKNKELTDVVKKTREELTKKVNVTDFKEKVKKNKKKLRSQIEQTQRDLEDKINGLEKRFVGRVEELQNKVLDVEKHTLWKIRDCEELLKLRINEKYVDDAIAKLDARLSYEMKKFTEGQNQNIAHLLGDTMKRIDQIETTLEDKLGQIRKSLKDNIENTNKKLDITIFEQFKKEIHAKTDTVSEKLRDYAKKMDPFVEKYTNDMRTIETKLNKYDTKINNLEVKIENLMLNGNNISQQIQQPSSKEDAADAAKRATELEALFSKYREDIQRHHQLIMQIQDSLATKLDIGTFNLAISKKVDKDEYLRAMSQLSVDEEKMKKLMQIADDIQGKIDKMNEMTDKKLAKLKKELDLNALLRALKTKAEEENVLKGFTNVDAKIQALSEAIALLKKDLETCQNSLKAVGSQVIKFSDSGLITTKSVMPQQCLACGNNSNPHNPFGQVKETQLSNFLDQRGEIRENGVVQIQKTELLNVNLSKSMMNSAEERNPNFFGPIQPTGEKASSTTVLKGRPLVSFNSPGGGASPMKATLRPWSAKK